jgi:hypothetical protein
MLIKRIAIALVAGLVVGAGAGQAIFLARSGPQRKAAAEVHRKATDALDRVVHSETMTSELAAELRRTKEELDRQTSQIKEEIASIRSRSFREAAVFGVAVFALVLFHELRRRTMPAGGAPA